jgi:hypothetical protein
MKSARHGNYGLRRTPRHRALRRLSLPDCTSIFFEDAGVASARRFWCIHHRCRVARCQLWFDSSQDASGRIGRSGGDCNQSKGPAFWRRALYRRAITCFRVGNRPQQLTIRTVDSLCDLAPLSHGAPVSWSELSGAPRWSYFVRSESRPTPDFIELGELFSVPRGQVTGSTRRGLKTLRWNNCRFDFFGRPLPGRENSLQRARFSAQRRTCGGCSTCRSILAS